MAYTSISEVNALLPNALEVNATASPTTPQVQTWIDQCEAQVDVALAAGGATSPATDASVKKAIALLVATEVARRVVVKKSNGEEDDNTAFDRAIKEMRAGEWLAPTEADVDGAGEPWCTTMDSSGTFPSDPYAPAFTKDQVF